MKGVISEELIDCGSRLFITNSDLVVIFYKSENSLLW